MHEKNTGIQLGGEKPGKGLTFALIFWKLVSATIGSTGSQGLTSCKKRGRSRARRRPTLVRTPVGRLEGKLKGREGGHSLEGNHDETVEIEGGKWHLYFSEKRRGKCAEKKFSLYRSSLLEVKEEKKEHGPK